VHTKIKSWEIGRCGCDGVWVVFFFWKRFGFYSLLIDSPDHGILCEAYYFAVEPNYYYFLLNSRYRVIRLNLRFLAVLLEFSRFCDYKFAAMGSCILCQSSWASRGRGEARRGCPPD
jgi:hypothetical protein